MLEGPAETKHKVFKPENLELAPVTALQGGASASDGGAQKRKRTAQDLFEMNQSAQGTANKAGEAAVSAAAAAADDEDDLVPVTKEGERKKS